MKLHRFAMLELHPPPGGLDPERSETIDGVLVTRHGQTGAHASAPDPTGLRFSWGSRRRDRPLRVMLRATLDFVAEYEGQGPLVVPDDERSRTEGALEMHAALTSVIHHCGSTLVSPVPFIAVEPTNVDEVGTCAAATRVHLPKHGRGLARPILDEQKVNALDLMADRRTGLVLANAALSASSPIGKLHELFRVIENGFKLAGEHKLTDPLTNFLRTYPDRSVGYTRDEVLGWIKALRNPATHADLARSKNVLFDKDVAPHLPRIEQAALDVLFNKKDWHRQNPQRRQGVRFPTLNGPPPDHTGIVMIDSGGEIRTDQSVDHFGSFAFDPGCTVGWADSLSPGSIAALTHYPEAGDDE